LPPKLREENILRIFENRVLRRILDLRGRNSREVGEDCIMRSFITCTFHGGGWDGRGIYYAWNEKCI
jgi:hypothetical protein